MVSADAARTLNVLAEQRKAITAARRDGDHTRALELLIQQRDLLLPEAAKSKADEALIAPILGQIERHMRAVRDEMHGGGGGRAGGGEGAEARSGGADGAATDSTTSKGDEGAKTMVSGKGGGAKREVKVDVVAVDQALAKRTKHDWGAPPAALDPDGAEDDFEILDDVDLNGCLEQDVGYGGAKNAVVKPKPFEPPTRKSPGAKRGRKKKAGEPKQRWSGEGERDVANKPPTRFMSAGERLDLENAAKGLPPAHTQYRAAKETNGATRTYGRGRSGTGFVPPYGGSGNGQRVKPNQGGNDDEEGPPFSEPVMQKLSPNGEPIAEDILKLDREIVERVVSEILDKHESVDWDSIAGLEHPKAAVQELAVWPMMNPELFVGARAVPKGLLLFGPPGTGKTLIGRAVASQCGATFFSISASSLTSKWIGEGEKMVRALFAVARHLSPAVIFFDEIDSLLSARKSDGEHESSRRMKTEFLVQMDGLGGGENDRLLLIGATNRPQELDDGARRRMPKQLYIPLPCAAARRDMVLRTLSAGKGVAHNLSESDLDTLCEKTDGYSGSDMKHLIQEAARAPVRETFQKTKDMPGPVSPSSLRPIVLADIRRAAKQVRPSVTRADVEFHEEWNRNHGALTANVDCDDDDDAW